MVVSFRACAAALAIAALAPATAAAAPSLSVSAAHAPATLLKATSPNTTVYKGTLTLTVRNDGADPTDGTPVTVTEALPSGLGALVNNPGLGAGPTAASGPGWTCTGTTTSRCTRSDVLAPGASYPSITVTASVSSGAAASLTNAPTVAGGGAATTGTGADTIPVSVDACPNGWSTEAHVAFGPPTPAVDSGVLNPSRPDGCTLLDVIWSAEPFADHAAFVAEVTADAASFADLGLLTDGQASAIDAAAGQSGVAGPDDHALDNSCTRRIAMTYDDGPSAYRSQTLGKLRAEDVEATFFDLGVRLAANPRLSRFEQAEGHVVLLHTYDHANLNNIPLPVQQFEVTQTKALFAANGVDLPYDVLRPPYLSISAATQATLATMGFTAVPNPINASDWLPTNSAATTAAGIVRQLRPGVEILLHDGPIDSPAGQATVDATPLIIDAARAAGYCFGVIDRAGNVAADRYVPTTNPIPAVTNPVPYIPIGYAGTPPDPWYLVPQPLRIAATHSPSVLVQGATGTITLNVSNPTTDTPTDGSTTTVTDAIPKGLTATGVGGPGWTCAGTATITCTRSDVLAPGAAYPPIAIAVTVAATAAPNLTNAPGVTGRGGTVWVGSASDVLPIGVPASGSVSGGVPATLSLTLGGPASFGSFVPGVAKTYTASTTADVVSTAGDATLTVSDPGHLTNGAFSLPSPLAVTGVPRTWSAPVSHEVVPIGLSQDIGATDALRTGTYSTTLTFTLSTTSP